MTITGLNNLTRYAKQSVNIRTGFVGKVIGKDASVLIHQLATKFAYELVVKKSQSMKAQIDARRWNIN